MSSADSLLLSLHFIGPRAEMMCMDCGDGLDVGIPSDGSLDALKTIRILQLGCSQTGSEFASSLICDLMIDKLAELTENYFNR